MYPKLSDLINDLFGTNIVLPIQTYGFFLALAFVVAAILLKSELKRKEKEGKIKAKEKVVIVNKKLKIYEIFLSLFISFIAFYKFSYLVLNFDKFSAQPQKIFFSSDGNFALGIILSIIYTALVYYFKNIRNKEIETKKNQLIHPHEHTWPIIVIGVILGIFGAKLFHWLENWNDFVAAPIENLTSFAGMSFYGGLILAAIGIVWYTTKNGFYWKHTADVVGPALILAYGIGRIGCHMAGDGDWGIVNLAAKPELLSFLPDWMWAYNYPHNIINEGIRIPNCTGPHCMQLPYPVYPTSVYETLMTIIIFGILWFLRKRIEIPGLLFSIYLMFNGTERFLIEKIRVNNQFTYFGLTFTQAELISTLIFITGLIFMITFVMQHKRKNNELTNINKSNN